MHLVIFSTTIRGEQGYLSYDKLAKKSKFSKVSFVITGDKKSMPFDANLFGCDVEYLDVNAQKRFASSEAIGWNKYARRNIALLRALELQPDFLLTIDDDNIPSDDYFDLWHQVFTKPATQIVTGKKDIEHAHWHNYLRTADAEIELYPRGLPIPFRYKDSTEVVKADTPIPAERIGVFQGISLGDPDIDAMTRIVYSKPLPLNTIQEKNYCLKEVWSPYNSQNTAFAKTVFPLAFMWPQAGRFEDIYASFVWQRFLFNNDMYAHVGDAVNRQDRGKRDDLRDFNLEVEGYQQSHDVWEAVNSVTETNALSFIDALMKLEHPVIKRERDFLVAYKKDLEKIL